MTLGSSAVGLVLLLGGALQEELRPPKDGPSTAVFWAEASYVEVDAVVTDANGYTVRGLTRGDFEIFEEGVPQQIATFTEVALPVETVPAPVAATTSSAVEHPPTRHAATNEEGLEGRIYVLVLDALHTDPRRSSAVRKAARRFVDEYMTDGDIAAVVYTDGRTDAAQTFTSERSLLQASIERFTGRKVESAELEKLNLLELSRRPDKTLPLDAQRVADARTAMETLENVVRGIGDIHGRRKAILFFSEGSSFDTLDTAHDSQQRGTDILRPMKAKRDAADVASALRDAIASAARGNVAVYTIDPRGLSAPHGGDDMEIGGAPQDEIEATLKERELDKEFRRAQHGLHTLAEETGGFAALNTNDFGSAYERIVHANSRYYLLGYYPTDFRRDGKFRRIEVRVRPPGLVVAARDGYRRPTEKDELERRPAVGAEDETSVELRELLERPWSQPGLTLGVTAAALPGEGGASQVAVTIEVPGSGLPFGQEGDRSVNELEVAILAIDSGGRVRGGDRFLAQPSLSSETYRLVQSTGLRFVRSLDLPPGRYQLRIAARESRQGKRGSVFYDLQVPERHGDSLAVSDVLLASRAAASMPTPSLDGRVEQGLGTSPTVVRSFASDDQLTTYAEVYGAMGGGDSVTVTTRVTSGDGSEVFRVQEQRAVSELPTAGEPLGHRAEIPLADFGPGRYRLQVEARRGAGQVVASPALSFDVIPRARETASPGDSAAATPPASRLDRVVAWLAAVETHEPGAPDGPAVTVRAWGPGELAELATDLSVLVHLIEEPDYPVLWLVDPERPGRPRRSHYSMDDEQRLRALARTAAGGCAVDRFPDRDAARRCARNRLLKRGAVLHTDAAIRVADDTVRAGSARRPDRWQVRFSDGAERGTEGAPGHMELAQALLDNVAPKPGKDETVRLWYVATSAYGQYYARYARHEERALELFPGDPELLFLAGSLHETFATPTLQNLVRSIDTPRDTEHGIESAKSELEEAEKLFRLGRVLHRLGRQADAARELERAVAALGQGGEEDDLLTYYAHMFLGATKDELGEHTTARASYLRASALYPEAPSPLLALSQLALRGDDRGRALEALQRALAHPAKGGQRDDPLWRYYRVQGRRVNSWFGELYASLTTAP